MDTQSVYVSYSQLYSALAGGSVLAIAGGVIKVSKDKVIILANSIEREDEIDETRAQAALQRAKDRIEKKDPNLFTGKIILPQSYDDDSVPFENEDEATKEAFRKAEEILSADNPDDANDEDDDRSVLTAYGKEIKSEYDSTRERMEEKKKSFRTGRRFQRKSRRTLKPSEKKMQIS